MTRSQTTTLTARTPEDLLALAPVLLGFHAEESLVMLTFGAGAFHARVDLPASRAEIGPVVHTLLDPVVRHGLRRVVFLVFSASPTPAGLARRLIAEFVAHDIGVIDVLRADGRRWFPVRDRGEGGGTAYDIGGHPFLAEAVLRGQVTLGSREELAAGLATIPARAAALSALLDRPTGPLAAGQLAAEGAWLSASMAGAGRGATLPDPALARLLRALRHPLLVQQAVSGLKRDDAVAQVGWWTPVVAAAPAGWVAGPASVLGFAAWLGGQGALAWCAVERAEADQPGHRPARALAALLANAVPPSHWERLGAGLPAGGPA